MVSGKEAPFDAVDGGRQLGHNRSDGAHAPMLSFAREDDHRRCAWFLTDRHSAKAAGFTRPLFAHLVVIHQMSDSYTPAAGVSTSSQQVLQSPLSSIASGAKDSRALSILFGDWTSNDCSQLGHPSIDPVRVLRCAAPTRYRRDVWRLDRAVVRRWRRCQIAAGFA